MRCIHQHPHGGPRVKLTFVPGKHPQFSLRTEAIAGVTTFLTVVYIIVVNPSVLSAEGKTGITFSGALTATVVVCFVMTLLMGVYARLPFAVAPGLGQNAFFAYTVIIAGQVHVMMASAPRGNLRACHVECSTCMSSDSSAARSGAYCVPNTRAWRAPTPSNSTQHEPFAPLTTCAAVSTRQANPLPMTGYKVELLAGAVLTTLEQAMASPGVSQPSGSPDGVTPFPEPAG